jgi:hypothetical protein
MMGRTFLVHRDISAVLEDTGTCTCGMGHPVADTYPHMTYCGMELVGFLPQESCGVTLPSFEPDLLPSSLWDFASLDYGKCS